MPRSRSLTARRDSPAACASSSWVSPVSARSCRSNSANPSPGCSATGPAPLATPARAHPSARAGPTPQPTQTRPPQPPRQHWPGLASRAHLVLRHPAGSCGSLCGPLGGPSSVVNPRAAGDGGTSRVPTAGPAAWAGTFLGRRRTRFRCPTRPRPRRAPGHRHRHAQARPGASCRAAKGTSHACIRTVHEGPARRPAPRRRRPASHRPGRAGTRHRDCWVPAVVRTPRMRGQTVAWRWLRRVRGWWPDRNPLRRRCDRAEAALVTALVAVFLAGAPLLAVSAGRWAPDGGPRPGHARLAGWHQVPAVLRTATIQRFAPSPATAWARWAAPGGVERTGRVLAPAGLAAGAVVRVWVDAAGRLAGPPALPGRHDSRALAEGAVAVL